MSETNTYTWKIAAMDAYTKQGDYTDVVYTIHWRYNAVDQSASYSAEVYGAQSVAPYNPESGSFVPFDDLSKDVVVGWLTGSMGEDRVIELRSVLDNQINEQKNPKTIVLSPPWDRPTPTPTAGPTPTPTAEPGPTPTPMPTYEPVPSPTPNATIPPMPSLSVAPSP